MQKLIYAIVIPSRKLKNYFQAHAIEVKTGFAIGDVVCNREAIGQVAKWAIELGQYEITFSSWTAIKGQALADFITEWLETQIPPAIQNLEYWEMYFDGSLQLSGAGAGVLLLTPQKDPLKYVLQMHFRASNNAAEYEALLHGLRVAVSLGVKCLDVYGDLIRAISQINKVWDAHDDHMMAYRQELRKLEDKFDGLRFSHILGGNNSAADELARLGSSRQVVPPGVFLHVLEKTVY